MGKISKKELDHIGELLAVKFDERSPQITGEQLNSLLTSFAEIQKAQIAAPTAAADTPEHTATLREDKNVQNSLDSEAVLKAAPQRKDDFIVVKPVF